ncbi:hypothetical protein S7711_06632 [Stachybotrys chartarum IBT 7711]|uniref:DNA repair metallo-beta-lactamase domain-containing protein n=1 Tax=Stachybotrys chartarum (strain CBS 109288 / IBT 7711) TaxID=1280523 RepID=A0A084AKZ5_STACB|nr:hypothetical protein S7711_06632 [Stachybotrys chartarum IBT 7711]
MGASAKSSRSHTPRKPAAKAQKPVAANASILAFFKKAEKRETSLFIGDTAEVAGPNEDLYGDDPRYNEIESPVKKRRLSEDDADTSARTNPAAPVVEKAPEEEAEPDVVVVPKKPKPRGFMPFAMDSESDDDDDDDKETIAKTIAATNPKRSSPSPPKDVEISLKLETTRNPFIKDEPAMLKHEDSTYEQFDHIEEQIDDQGDLDMDDFEGEEFREMRYMREQAQLEAQDAGGGSFEDFPEGGFEETLRMDSCCPICEASLTRISVEDANRHVNACLDGNPIPLPQEIDPPEETSKVEITEIGKRFLRAAVPRPAQSNPLEEKSSDNAPRSAFSKLMSNNAEDSAWAAASAQEHASRGRPAYERTCPFYKIMPGFSICVDAFRYGAVQGCKAYFLSHFHSDHYIGLTASWCHGPIYCSKVTGSLVKKQLRTAAQWVVELEFDKTCEIPGTGGASVTMIPANHCPGSSLFLFEKQETLGSNTRTKRILHCGDFRACPAHVGHPLLRADVKDSISGKVKQQKIDICYLDTTYLNPRYSFPPQADVITACADLCASMSADPECQDDVWEKQELAAGTPAVSKYFHSTKSSDADAASPQKAKPRQRLLVICGTYSIGKERICVAIAKALGSKIFASPSKIRICKQLDDPELTALLTSDPLEAQVHMQMLMEIRAETLQEYLNSYKPHFSRIVGLRPSGWNFRPANGKAITANTAPSTIPTQQVLHGKGWRTRFGYRDFVRQRGSTKEAMCIGVPYSEHSSFRELAMFVMSLRIEKVIPTVNVGSEQSRKRMKGWIDRWMAERRKGGLLRPLIEGQDDEDDGKHELWDGKSGKGGSAWW